MGHPPQIGHLGQFAPDRNHQTARANQTPRHPAPLEAGWPDHAQGIGRVFERREKLVSGKCVAGKVQVGE